MDDNKAMNNFSSIAKHLKAVKKPIDSALFHLNEIPKSQYQNILIDLTRSIKNLS